MGCKVIAHRGSNKKAPQNTLPAFEQAIREGTNGFETDVHLTKDKKLVICHNYSVNDTSDGRGDITSYTLAELKKLDFGSYFGADFAGTKIPTLEEFLELVVPTDTEIINIELKRPKKDRSLMVRKTLETVKRFGALDRIIISSFDAKILKTVKETDPRCKTAFLYPSTNPKTCRFEIIPFLTAKHIGADIIHPMYPLVSKGIVFLAHKFGMKVNSWTVNDETTVRRLLFCGVDGIITDCPGKVRAFVEKYEKK